MAIVVSSSWSLETLAAGATHSAKNSATHKPVRDPGIIKRLKTCSKASSCNNLHAMDVQDLRPSCMYVAFPTRDTQQTTVLLTYPTSCPSMVNRATFRGNPVPKQPLPTSQNTPGRTRFFDGPNLDYQEAHLLEFSSRPPRSFHTALRSAPLSLPMPVLRPLLCPACPNHKEDSPRS